MIKESTSIRYHPRESNYNNYSTFLEGFACGVASTFLALQALKVVYPNLAQNKKFLQLQQTANKKLSGQDLSCHLSIKGGSKALEGKTFFIQAAGVMVLILLIWIVINRIYYLIINRIYYKVWSTQVPRNNLNKTLKLNKRYLYLLMKSQEEKGAQECVENDLPQINLFKDTVWLNSLSEDESLEISQYIEYKRRKQSILDERLPEERSN